MAKFSYGGDKVIINNQFNTPINLYSTNSLNETLTKHSNVLSNGAVGIDFHQLAAPNLAKSAVLRMLEEQEENTTTRGEINLRRWPPPPNTTITNNTRVERAVPEKRTAAIVWPPKASTATSNHQQQSNSTWRRRSQQGVKRVAWPPPPDPDVIPALNSQNGQGEFIQTNGVHVEANPPAELYYSPAPKSAANNNINNNNNNNFQYNPAGNDVNSTAPVTVFSIPCFSTPAPPSVVTLRTEVPITQPRAPVYKSQPAILNQGTNNKVPKMLRGDQKWPPAQYKAMKEAEQAEQIARGPAIKPKLVKKDYSSFFAQHALTPTYAGYRAPPGTQHFDEHGRPVNM